MNIEKLKISEKETAYGAMELSDSLYYAVTIDGVDTGDIDQYEDLEDSLISSFTTRIIEASEGQEAFYGDWESIDNPNMKDVSLNWAEACATLEGREVEKEKKSPKEAKAHDIKSSKEIRTAVENSMADEMLYELLTENQANKYIEVSESSLAEVSEKLKETMLSYLDGSIPEVWYTENGQRAFYFYVEQNASLGVYGQIKVYAGDGNTFYSLCPEMDDIYN